MSYQASAWSKFCHSSARTFAVEKRRAVARAGRACAEPLERRQLLAGTAVITDLGTFVGEYNAVDMSASDLNEAGQVAGQASAPGGIYHAFLFAGEPFRDLGTFGGPASGANALNNTGQVVGWSNTAGDSDTHAFLYTGGQMQDLGTLGGRDSSAADLNEAGQVVGSSDTASEGEHAFLYADGRMQDLGTLGGMHSRASDVNEAGQIVGWSNMPNDQTHAFLYADGRMQDLGSLDGRDTSATHVNDAGQVVGIVDYEVASGQFHAFLYAGGTMRDLGTLGGKRSDASDVNEAGQVVGSSYIAGDNARHAFLYADGRMRDLGTLGGGNSEASDVNEAGQVVGSADNVEQGGVAFLFTDANGNGASDPGEMIDLNDLLPAGSGWTLDRATHINDSGQVVVGGYLNGGEERRLALLDLEPDLPDPTAPAASLPSLPAIVTAGGTSQSFTVTYAAAVDAASVDRADVVVTRASDGAALTVSNAKAVGSGRSVAATYTVAARGGTWDNADNGNYVVSVVAGQVRNGSGLTVPAGAIGGFQVGIPGAVPTPDPVVTEPAGPLAGEVIARVPSAAIGGQKVKAKVQVVVLNRTGNPLASEARIDLYLAAGPAPATSDKLLATTTKTLKLNAGRSKALNLKLAGGLLPVVADGAYQLLAVVSSGGTPSDWATGPGIAIRAPFVDLAASFAGGPSPASAPPGGQVRAALRLDNLGNVAAAGTVNVTVRAASTSASKRDVAVIPVRVKLKPAAGKAYKLKLTLPPDLAAGSYTLEAMVDGSSLGDAVSENDVATSTAFVFG